MAAITQALISAMAYGFRSASTSRTDLHTLRNEVQEATHAALSGEPYWDKSRDLEDLYDHLRGAMQMAS